MTPCPGCNVFGIRRVYLGNAAMTQPSQRALSSNRLNRPA
jgi:hypothetical protein